jgi:hypothetical protein
MVEVESKVMASLLFFGTHISDILPKSISMINPNSGKIMR